MEIDVLAEEGSPEELRRLQAVAACALLDTPRETAFDNIVFTAAQLFRVPMAMLAIVDQNRVWLKASVGPLPSEVAPHETFCAAAVHANDIVIVEDATSDLRFSKLPIVVGHPNVRFYIGVPLRAPGNLPVATLSVLDRQPRTVPDRARLQLLQLAKEAELLLRRRVPDEGSTV